MKKIMMALCVAVAAALNLELAAAELPSGYEAVDSVTANGAQYVDTGVTVQEELTAEVTFMYTRNVAKCVLGVGTVRLPTPEHAAINRKYHVTTTFAETSSADTLYLFACNDGGVAEDLAWARVYAVKLTLGETVVRDFVPCKERTTGALGLYDQKEGVFYPSAGAKPFFLPWRAGVYGGLGGTGSVFELYRLVDRSPEVELVNISGAMAQEGSVFDRVDMIVMPGGSSKNELASLGAAGQANLISYIRNGGTYYGTCAGSHLVLADELNISGYARNSYYDGSAYVDIAIGAEGMQELGLEKAIWNARYHQGPFIVDGPPVEGADLKVWGVYTNTDIVAASGTGNRMEGKYAILAGRYFDGRMLVIASHPESNYQNFPFIRQSWRWLSGRDDITTETSAMSNYTSGRTNVFYVSTYADGIYPLAETMLRVDEDPRMNLVAASATSFSVGTKYMPNARAFIADTAGNAAAFQRGDYKEAVDSFKANGGLVLIEEDGITKDELTELVDGIASDRRTRTSVAWDENRSVSFAGDQTLTGLDVRLATKDEYVTMFTDGEIVFAADENRLGGDWAYCAAGAVHRVVVNNARVSAVYGNHRRDSFCTVAPTGTFTPVASNRFEITLGPRNIAGGPAVVSFEKDLVIAKNSMLKIDARWMPAGAYKIIEAGALSIKSSDFVDKATVTVDADTVYSLVRDGSAIVLKLAVGSALDKVDYVESFGAQYIDTGICLQDKIVLDLDFEWTSSSGGDATYAGMFGVSHKEDDGRTYKCYLAYTSNSSKAWRCSLGTSAMKTLTGFSGVGAGTRYHLTATVDGTSVAQSVNGSAEKTTAFTDTDPLATYPRTFYLGAVNLNGVAGSRWPSRIYSAKVYTNMTVLARDYWPCYQVETGTYGLYDKVTKTFHPSAEGAFAGAALSGKPEPVDPKPDVLPTVVCDAVTARPQTNFAGSVVTVHYSTWDVGAGWKVTPTLTVGGHVYAGAYDAAMQTATFVVPADVARAGTIQTAVADVVASWTAAPGRDTLSSAANRLVQGELRTDRNWFDERAETLGGTGTWAPTPTVSGRRILIEQPDGTCCTFEPNRPHEGTVALVEVSLCYNGFRIEGTENLKGSQAACTIVPNQAKPGTGRFAMLLDGDWVTNETLVAERDKAYSVQVALDYGTNPTALTYNLKTDGDPVCLGSGHSASAARQASQVDIYGEGAIESLVGTEVAEWADASLVEANGVRYATVEAALAAGKTDIHLLWDATAKPDSDVAKSFTVDKDGYGLYLKGRRFQAVRNPDGTYTYTWTIPGAVLYIR